MGTVPMSQRRDPVVGVAEAIRRMERKCDGVANRTGEYIMCGTSFINIYPNNAVNIGQQVVATLISSPESPCLSRNLMCAHMSVCVG